MQFNLQGNGTDAMPDAKSFKACPYLLQNQIQHYAWGTRDADAFIPRLLGQPPESGQPYAELWMGAHPSAPSGVVVEGSPLPLPEFVAAHPQAVLGPDVCRAFDNAWPFLFKVLSIGAPLSIQAHPDRAQAAQLHARDPQNYPDAHHKPEIAIALDRLTALVGFKDFRAIQGTLACYPEIAAFIGAEAAEAVQRAAAVTAAAQRALVRQMYAALMSRARTNETGLSAGLARLAARLAVAAALTEHEALFLEARTGYPGAEVGLLALFFLNLVHLERGQGIYLAPGVPHAYLKGNIVECMANSDNVVRAGLTPKFKDIPTLIDILTYELGEPPILAAGADGAPYRTPAAEFQVSRWDLAPGESRSIARPTAPAIWLITQGAVRLTWAEGETTFRRGQAVLLPAALRALTVTAPEPAEVFQATTPPSD